MHTEGVNTDITTSQWNRWCHPNGKLHPRKNGVIAVFCDVIGAQRWTLTCLYEGLSSPRHQSKLPSREPFLLQQKKATNIGGHSSDTGPHVLEDAEQALTAIVALCTSKGQTLCGCVTASACKWQIQHWAPHSTAKHGVHIIVVLFLSSS